MLTRFKLIILGMLVPALGLASPADGEKLSAVVKRFTVATQAFKADVVGKRTSKIPSTVSPLQKADGQSYASETIGFRGEFKWQRPQFRATVRFGEDPMVEEITFDGKQITTVRAQNRHPDGTDASTLDASLGTVFPLCTHFGTFSTGQLPLPEKQSLDDFLASGTNLRFKKAGDTNRYQLRSGSTDVLITTDDQGRLTGYQFVRDQDTVRTVQTWSQSRFTELEDAQIPTLLKQRLVSYASGQLVADEEFVFELKNLSRQVNDGEIVRPLPEGTLLSTYDGKKAGRAVMQSGSRQSVDSDYGSPAYTRRMALMWGGGLLALIGIVAFAWNLLRKRKPKSPTDS